MGALVIPHVSGGTLTYEELGAGRRQGHIRERVSITADSTHALLTRRLPEGARVVWASLKNVTAVAVQFDSGSTTTTVGTGGYALAIASGSAITSLSTSATTDFILRSATTAATAGTFAIDSGNRGVEKNNAARENLTDPRDTTDASNYIFLAPALFTTATGGIYTFHPNTSTPASGYNFSAAATVDIDLWFEEFEETPNNA